MRVERKIGRIAKPGVLAVGLAAVLSGAVRPAEGYQAARPSRQVSADLGGSYGVVVSKDQAKKELCVDVTFSGDTFGRACNPLGEILPVINDFQDGDLSVIVAADENEALGGLRLGYEGKIADVPARADGLFAAAIVYNAPDSIEAYREELPSGVR